jgi:hypothetical protein
MPTRIVPNDFSGDEAAENSACSLLEAGRWLVVDLFSQSGLVSLPTTQSARTIPHLRFLKNSDLTLTCERVLEDDAQKLLCTKMRKDGRFQKTDTTISAARR